MNLSMDLALPDSPDLPRTRPTSAQPASTLTHDVVRDACLGLRRSAEHVQNALDNLKRSAGLSGADLTEADIKIGENVIIVDDRFRGR